jgi:hypothetical protein
VTEYRFCCECRYSGACFHIRPWLSVSDVSAVTDRLAGAAGLTFIFTEWTAVSGESRTHYTQTESDSLESSLTASMA